MSYGIIGLVCFIGALFAGRWVNERGLRKLDEKDSAKLVQGLSRYRMVSMIGVIVIVAVYFVFVFQNAGDNKSFPIFAGLLILYMLAGTAFVFVKLKRLAISDEYINAYLLSTSIQYIGIIVYFSLARLY
jgi:hypothetical protein